MTTKGQKVFNYNGVTIDYTPSRMGFLIIIPAYNVELYIPREIVKDYLSPKFLPYVKSLIDSNGNEFCIWYGKDSEDYGEDVFIAYKLKDKPLSIIKAEYPFDLVDSFDQIIKFLESCISPEKNYD